MGIPEVEEIEQRIKNLFEEIKTEIFTSPVKEKKHKGPESTESPKHSGPKEAHTKTHHN